MRRQQRREQRRQHQQDEDHQPDDSAPVDGEVVPELAQHRRAGAAELLRRGGDGGRCGHLASYWCRMRGLINPYSRSMIRFTAMMTTAISSSPACTTG